MCRACRLPADEAHVICWPLLTLLSACVLQPACCMFVTSWHSLRRTQVFVFNAENYSGDAQLVNR